MLLHPIRHIASLLLLLCLAVSARAQVQTSCLEVESIFVDACGPSEGENEMVRFRVGPNAVNTANLMVDWPNNNWLGTCQSAATANKLATLNSGITNCGLLVEPVNGIIPAHSQGLLITSTSFSTINNSFAALSDTLYVVFQCSGNTAGHFANAGAGARSLIMYFGSSACADTVTYMRNLLIGGDGARADFQWNGTDSYHNDGCQAPFIPMTVDAGPDQNGCSGSPISLSPLLNGAFVTVVWSGGAGTFTTGTYPAVDYTPAASESGPVTLTVTATDCNGVSTTDNMVVTVQPGANPAITSSGPDSICTGTNVVLTASGGTSYAWSTGVSTTNLTVTTPGTYTVTVSTSCGANTADYEIFSALPPNASLASSGPDTICNGTPVTLTAAGGDTYAWSTGETTAAIQITAPGTYDVTVSTSCGTDNTSFEVFGFPPPQAANLTASGPTTFCDGGNVDLTASGGTQYAWSTGSTAPTITVTAAGNYEVTISDACASITASQTVTILPSPAAAINGNTIVCIGDTVNLTASGGDTYTWSTGATGPNLNGVTGGQYSVSVANACGLNVASILVSELPPPLADIIPAGSTVLCEGETVVLDGSGGGTYLWSNGSTGASIAAGATGTYVVTVTNACGSATASMQVTVNAVDASFTPSATTGDEPLDVNFLNTSSGATSFGWFFGDGGTSNSVSPSYQYTQEGTYVPMLIAENDAGCTDTARFNRILVVGFSELWIPLAFTPNFDGKNEVFKLYGTNITYFHCDLFDRWGHIMYSWDDINKGWDGNTQSGPAPFGVYVYRVQYAFGNELREVKTGHFTLVR